MPATKFVTLLRLGKKGLMVGEKAADVKSFVTSAG